MAVMQGRPGSLRALLGPRQGLIAVSLGAVLWGTNGVLVRYVSEHSVLSPIAIGFYRLVFSSVALILIAGMAAVRSWRAATVRQRLLMVVSGVLLGGYQALYFEAIGNVGVSVSTLVSLGVAPLAITLAHSIGARRLPGARSVVVLALALGGLALISAVSGHGVVGNNPALGLIESVGSGLGYAGSTAVSSRLSAHAGPLTLTTIASVVGAVVLAPLAVISGVAFHPSPGVLASLVYMGVVATAVAYGLFFQGLRRTSADTASVLTLLEPLTATLLAVLIIGETLPAGGWIGAALMLVAVAVLYLRPGAAEAPLVIEAGTPEQRDGSSPVTMER